MAKIIQNGREGESDVKYGPLEKAVVAILTALSIAGVANSIALYREVGILGAQIGVALAQGDKALTKLDEHQKLPFHIGVYEHFLPRTELKALQQQADDNTERIRRLER